MVATGAFEQNIVFAGNEVPGVFLGRGAARLSAAHGIRVGDNAVVLGGTHEAPAHTAALREQGTAIEAVVLPARRRRRRASGARASCAAPCRRRTGARPSTPSRSRWQEAAPSASRATCSRSPRGFTPQENLLRQTYGEPVWACGDVVAPGPVEQVIADAREVGAAAAGGERIELPALGTKTQVCGSDGYVCICYDVTVGEIERSVKEGFRSTELLKRYTTATMGACQGRLCHGQLRELSERFSPGGDAHLTSATTARPPARPLRLEEAVAGNRHHLERRTGLHDTHLGLGARVPVGRAVEARRALRQARRARPDRDPSRVPRRARGRRDHRRRHARQVPRDRARRRRLPRAAVPEPGRRPRAGTPALRPAARRGRRDPRRRNDLPDRRADLLPDGHDLGRRGGRGDHARLARDLGPRRARREPDVRDRGDQRGRPEGAGGPLARLRRRHLEGGASRTSVTAASPSRASPAPRSGSASSARSGGSCTIPRRARPSSGTRCSRPAPPTASRRSGSRPSGCSGSRRATSSSRRTPTSRRRRGTSAWSWAVKLDKDDFVGKAALLRKKDRKTEKLVGFTVDTGRRRALGGRGREGRRQARPDASPRRGSRRRSATGSASPGCRPSAPSRASG